LGLGGGIRTTECHSSMWKFVVYVASIKYNPVVSVASAKKLSNARASAPAISFELERTGTNYSCI